MRREVPTLCHPHTLGHRHSPLLCALLLHVTWLLIKNTKGWCDWKAQGFCHPKLLIPPSCWSDPLLGMTGFRGDEKLKCYSWRYKQVYIPKLVGALKPSPMHYLLLTLVQGPCPHWPSPALSSSITVTSVVGWTIASKDARIPITPETVNVTLHGKGTLQMWIN